MTLQTTHHHKLPPAESRVVDLWFQGKVSDKQIAQALDISPRSAGDTWQRLMMRLHLPPGSRREHAIIELIDRGWITISRAAAMLLLGYALLHSCVITGNASRNLRTARTRRNEYHYVIEQRAAA